MDYSHRCSFPEEIMQVPGTPATLVHRPRFIDVLPRRPSQPFAPPQRGGWVRKYTNHRLSFSETDGQQPFPGKSVHDRPSKPEEKTEKINTVKSCHVSRDKDLTLRLQEYHAQCLKVGQAYSGCIHMSKC